MSVGNARRGKRELKKRESGDEIIKNRSIRAASKRRSFTSALVVFLIAALLLTGAVWGTISFIDANSLRIYIDRSDVGAISLSASRDFNSASSVLRMKGPDEMNNTTYEWIRQRSEILGKDGDHHEQNVIAYSFYLRNMGQSPLLYTSSIVLNRLSRDVENALRVIVIEQTAAEGEQTDELTGYSAVCYAMADFDGNAEYISYDTDDKATQIPRDLEPGEFQLDALLESNLTVPFAGHGEDEETCTVFEHTDSLLLPEEVKKFTVLVWVEGSDSDCTDAIIGSYVNFEYFFEVTDPNAEVA